MRVLSALCALTTAQAATLYATHYSGEIYTLSLDHVSANDSYALSLASSKRTCGSMPSWLTFDASAGILYCSDETGDTGASGGLFAYSVGEDGGLSEVARTEAPGGGVSSLVYGGRFLVSAH